MWDLLLQTLIIYSMFIKPLADVFYFKNAQGISLTSLYHFFIIHKKLKIKYSKKEYLFLKKS